MITTNVQCAHCDHLEPVRVTVRVDDVPTRSGRGSLFVDVTAEVGDDEMADVKRRFAEHCAAVGHPVG